MAMTTSSLLTLMHMDFIIQQLQFLASLREGDRVWVSRTQVLERDTNRGLLATVQRTVFGQSRERTFGGIERIYDNAIWWLDHYRMLSGPHETTDPLKLVEAIDKSFAGLAILQTTYTADPVFVLRLQLLEKTMRTTVETRALLDAHRDGAHREDAHRDGAHREDAHRDGAHREDAHRDGAHRDGTHRDGAHRDGTHQESRRVFHEDSSITIPVLHPAEVLSYEEDRGYQQQSHPPNHPPSHPPSHVEDEKSPRVAKEQSPWPPARSKKASGRNKGTKGEV